MELGSTIHQSWSKRFESFLSTREPGGGSLWFLLVLRFFHSFPFSSLVNGSFFSFFFVLVLTRVFQFLLSPLWATYLLFMLSCFRWYVTSLALPQGFHFKTLSAHPHTPIASTLDHHPPLSLWDSCLFSSHVTIVPSILEHTFINPCNNGPCMMSTLLSVWILDRLYYHVINCLLPE